MIPLTIKEIVTAVNGRLINDLVINDKSVKIENVFTDTRNASVNSLFVALIGESFDAHDFVKEAQEQGAKCLMVSKKVDSKLPQILVDDTQQGLAKLASNVREKVNPKVIGITGSAGKTTVKEMVANILKYEGSVLATRGNFNNHIGVPLTLLELTREHRFAVIEMGANHLGEIAFCASIARPDVSAINNVMPAHIEGFGSIEGVAKAKAEIYQALSKGGCAVINLDSEFAITWLKQSSSYQKVTISCHNSADFMADNIAINEYGLASFRMWTKIDSEQGEIQNTSIQLTIPGKHNVANALVAAALSNAVGASLKSIQMGLETLTEVKGRLNTKQGLNDSLIIDDTYNASVGSVKAAIDFLTSLSGDKLMVLGDMAELGNESDKYHSEVGLYAKEKGVDYFFGCGKAVKNSVSAFGNSAKLYTNKKVLIKDLKVSLVKNKTKKKNILVKGARSARMEEVVNALLAKNHGNLVVKKENNKDDLDLKNGGAH